MSMCFSCTDTCENKRSLDWVWHLDSFQSCFSVVVPGERRHGLLHRVPLKAVKSICRAEIMLSNHNLQRSGVMSSNPICSLSILLSKRIMGSCVHSSDVWTGAESRPNTL